MIFSLYIRVQGTDIFFCSHSNTHCFSATLSNGYTSEDEEDTSNAHNIRHGKEFILINKTKKQKKKRSTHTHSRRRRRRCCCTEEKKEVVCFAVAFVIAIAEFSIFIWLSSQIYYISLMVMHGIHFHSLCMR